MNKIIAALLGIIFGLSIFINFTFFEKSVDIYQKMIYIEDRIKDLEWRMNKVIGSSNFVMEGMPEMTRAKKIFRSPQIRINKKKGENYGI